MPIPGNAEFAIWFVIEIVFVLIWIIAKSVDTRQWVIYTTVLTSFYILSRGIAKASALVRLLDALGADGEVEVGEATVRFLEGGPRGRPELYAELFA